MAMTINKPIEKLLDAFRSMQGVTNEAKQGNKSLINTLKEMETAYANQVSQSMPNYDKAMPESTQATAKKYVEKSDKELYKQAENAVMEGINEKINSLNQNTEKKIIDLTDKINKSDQNFIAEINNSDQKYAKNNINALYNVTNRGLAYSSIYDNIKDDIHDKYVNELTQIRTEYDNLNAEIEQEISLLNSSKENALLEYDIERAVGIEKQLNKLKSDQQSTIAAVNKYNKQIADAETKYQAERAKTIEKLENDWRQAKKEQLEMEKRSGYTGDNLNEMNSRYDIAKTFYFGITKASAKKLLEENALTLKEALGNIYYNRLCEENNNR